MIIGELIVLNNSDSFSSLEWKFIAEDGSVIGTTLTLASKGDHADISFNEKGSCISGLTKAQYLSQGRVVDPFKTLGIVLVQPHNESEPIYRTEVDVDHIIGNYILISVENDKVKVDEKPIESVEVIGSTTVRALDINDIIGYKDLDFSVAIALLKYHHKRLGRKAWSANEFLVHQKAYPNGISCNKQTAEAWGMQEGDLFKCEPYLQKQTKEGSHEMYTPTMGDIFAHDWYVVE